MCPRACRRTAALIKKKTDGGWPAEVKHRSRLNGAGDWVTKEARITQCSLIIDHQLLMGRDRR